MSELPMHYQTAYQWTGEASQGEVEIENQSMMPVGSPHDINRYSPEHLLVVAAEACLANYVLLIAGLSKLEIKDYRSTAEGELVKEDTYRFKQITIRPQITVEAGKEKVAERVMNKSHKLCLVARSLNCPVEMEPEIKTV